MYIYIHIYIFLSHLAISFLHKLLAKEHKECLPKSFSLQFIIINYNFENDFH